VTKEKYIPLLKANPYIDKIFSIKKNVNEVLPDLKAVKYDFIIDLHKNIRSAILKLNLNGKKNSFCKLNIRKWILVRFKINFLPNVHIVDRYIMAASRLGIKYDGKGLDYFIPTGEEINISELSTIHKNGFVAIAIGSIHNTKQMPVGKLIALCAMLNKPIVLLGGSEDKVKADIITEALGDKVFNACGYLSINQSASLVKQADIIVSNDTGLMHIAAAFKKNIISVWGNTVPEFGMYPLLPDDLFNNSSVIEVKGLHCRPCSKLGFQKCPKQHFNCMNLIDESSIAEIINNKA
jgi:ADP-heptose:LPS heptosyltransferase